MALELFTLLKQHPQIFFDGLRQDSSCLDLIQGNDKRQLLRLVKNNNYSLFKSFIESGILTQTLTNFNHGEIETFRSWFGKLTLSTNIPRSICYLTFEFRCLSERIKIPGSDAVETGRFFIASLCFALLRFVNIFAFHLNRY